MGAEGASGREAGGTPPRGRGAAATVREYLEAILVAVILALFAKAFVVEAFQIPSASMEDTLLVGDHVLVDKFVYGPHRGPWGRLLPYADVARGDVVVFRSPEEPGRDFVKRAVALGGETVQVEDKRLLVDGTEPAEPYASHRDPALLTGPDVPVTLRGRDAYGPFLVPRGTFFAMGDNRDDSRDSRFWGPAPLDGVKGRAVLVYWSYDAGGASFTGRGAGVRRLLDTALHFFARSRWRRSFRAVR